MPTTFTDTQGRKWDLSLTVGTIKRVKSMLDIDLLNITDGQYLIDFSKDVWKLVDMLYVIVKPEADKLGVTDEDFGSALGGQSLSEASDAFLEAVENFFREWQPQVGETLATLRQKMTEMDRKSVELARAKLDDGRINRAMLHGYQDMEKQMDQALDESLSEFLTRGSSSPSVPESSE